MPPVAKNKYVVFDTLGDSGGRETRHFLGSIDLATGEWSWAPEPTNPRTAAHYIGESAARRAAARWSLAIRETGYDHGHIKIRKHNA